MHFMDLELKILKEKVVEDEKNSGIGSLFNDNKNKHEHINDLKTKYMAMKRDYDLRLDELEKTRLSVLESSSCSMLRSTSCLTSTNERWTCS